jgi:hypothetical protein
MVETKSSDAKRVVWHGCIRTENFTDSLLADGPWTCANDGVWVRDLDATSWTWIVELLLAVTPDMFTSEHPVAVVSHVTAANVYRSGVMSGPVELYTTSTELAETFPTIGGVEAKWHVVDVMPDWQHVEGIPTTLPALTIADLLAAHHDDDHVGRVADDMMRQGHATRAGLVACLGAGVLDRIMAAHHNIR